MQELVQMRTAKDTRSREIYRRDICEEEELPKRQCIPLLPEALPNTMRRRCHDCPQG